MNAASDYIGIRGWCATVVSITPVRKDGEIDYVVGEMNLLPHMENRDVQVGGKDLNLDVFFHCYTESVARKFFKAVSNNDTLIVSGDLNSRGWRENSTEPSTNFWLDEFVVDESKHTVSPLAGRLQSADMQEYAVAANHRYNDECVNCGKETYYIADDERTYCTVCDD